MKKDNNRIWLILGIVLMIVGAVFATTSVMTISKYDRVKAIVQIKVTDKGSKGESKSAYITYFYHNKIHSHVHLDSYNALTMKDGKDLTIYIDPEMPDKVKTTSFTWVALCWFNGLLFLWVCFKDKRKQQ